MALHEPQRLAPGHEAGDDSLPQPELPAATRSVAAVAAHPVSDGFAGGLDEPLFEARPDSAGRALAGVVGWRPIQLLALVLAVAVLAPMARSALDPFGSGGVSGTVGVDTSGAEGRIDGDQFELDLPLAVYNRTANVVVRVSMWTTAWDCPGLFTPTSQCRRLLSTGQDFALHLLPGGSASLPTRLSGGVPDGASQHGSVRIERQLENIYDDRDEKQSAAQAAFH